MLFKPFIRLVFMILLLLPFKVDSQSGSETRYLLLKEHHQLLKDQNYLFTKTVILEIGSDQLPLPLSFRYNRNYQQIKIKELFKIREGDTILLTAEAIEDIMEPGVDSASGLSAIRWIVIKPGIMEEGDIIQYSYEIATMRRLYPFFMGYDKIRKNIPVSKYEYKISVPDGKEIYYKQLHFSAEPEINSMDSMTSYTFSFDGLKAITSEGLFAAHPAKYLPHIIWSDINNFGRKFLRYVSQPAFNFAVDDSMLNYSHLLKTQSSDDVEFVLKIWDFVNKEIEELDLPMRIAGYWFRPPVEVFYDRKATPIEKATLICALLQNNGVYAIPALVGEKELVVSEVPNFDVFEDIYVRVFRLPEEYIYLPLHGPLTYNLKYDLNEKVVVPVLSQIKTLQYVKENNPDSYFHFEAEFTMNEFPVLSGNIKLAANEIFNPYYSIRSDSGMSGFLASRNLHNNFKILQKYKMSEEELLLGIDNVHWELLKTEVEHQFILPQDHSVKSYMLLLKSLDFMSCPLQINPVKMSFKYEIRLKNGIKALKKEESITRENELGKVVISYKSGRKNITVLRQLILKQQIIYPNQYKQLKELLIPWLNTEYMQIYLTNY